MARGISLYVEGQSPLHRVHPLTKGTLTLVIIVAEAGLGTLNATALTAEVATKRGLTVAGVIIGSWPAEPDLAALSNLQDLPVAAGAPLLGALPAGLGAAGHEAFLTQAKAGLSPWFGGEFDPELFAGSASAQK